MCYRLEKKSQLASLPTRIVRGSDYNPFSVLFKEKKATVMSYHWEKSQLDTLPIRAARRSDYNSASVLFKEK